MALSTFRTSVAKSSYHPLLSGVCADMIGFTNDYIERAKIKFKVAKNHRHEVQNIKPEHLQYGGMMLIPINKKDIVELIPLLQSMVAASQKVGNGDTDFARHRALIDMLEVQSSEALIAVVDDVAGRFYCQCE